jgi:hypothetical protein
MASVDDPWPVDDECSEPAAAMRTTLGFLGFVWVTLAASRLHRSEGER